MFTNETLKTYLETSPTVQLNSLILAEWNMNMPDNILMVGNYRYRPTDNTSIYNTIPNTFDRLDTGYYYTDATDADVLIDNGVTDNDTPQLFTYRKDKMKLLYSLEDCIKPFRPRSGINKASFFNGRFLNNSGPALAERPRYYMPSRYDQFRYWTSYRTETTYKYTYSNSSVAYGSNPKFTDLNGTVKNGEPFSNSEYGIAKNIVNSLNYISDAAPFVMYKTQVPANRLIFKMQTNVGTINIGTYNTQNGPVSDPLYGESNKTTPSRWKVQYLIRDNWIDAISFNENSVRENGSPVIGPDGYVELHYGLIVPDDYKDIFVFVDTLSSSTLLPTSSHIGDAYLVITNSTSVGTFYIYTGTGETGYQTFTPLYGWNLASEQISDTTRFVTDFTLPQGFINPVSGQLQYREFQYLQGIRVVVETMNKFDSTFDLIEMSPRLVGDISNKVLNYKTTKVLSDIGITSLPVGQLLASTGSMDIFDEDQAFNENNPGSIISPFLQKNIKFSFYENILNVEGSNYFIPIKTLYSEGFPQSNITAGTVSLNLRDFYFFLESMPAPQLLMTQTSLSVAICTLLDFIGFNNYTFKRVAGETDPIIPFFFVAPDQNVAEVLNQLAISTQSAMFFDEFNNFVVMSKDYLMPSESQRETNFVLSGSNNQTDSGVIENSTSGNLPNIISISSQDKKVYNDGQITYTERYIRRTYGDIRRASGGIDRDKTWIYEPSLLWEVSGTESLKTQNELSSKQGTYTLAAMPLNSNLSSDLPTVVNGVVINNTLDVGEGIWYSTRYNGYLYSSGEIIKYDAIQFTVGTSIWYPVLSNGLLDTSSPQIVPAGRVIPVEVENQFEAQLAEKIKAGDITSSQAVFEKEALTLNWISTHRDGGSNVWISSDQEYQKYFAQLPFNGKIYPTGLIRIYSEPYYETVDGIPRLQPGQVYKHGRGQFGTQVVSHTAGIDSYWTDPINVRGCNMQSSLLFTTKLDEDVQVPATTIGAAGVDNGTAALSGRTGIIKNFLATNYLTDTTVNRLKSTQSGTVQSSALVMTGPSFKTTQNPLNFVSYVYKQLNGAYKNFGTRMRIVGKIENNELRAQTPLGSTTYYDVSGVKPDEQVSIGGGSGGIAVLINPQTNNGYYFEIVALTEQNIDSYLKLDKDGNAAVNVNNIVFYKVKKDASNNDAIPIKLWGGLTSVVADNGLFTGQYRMAGEEIATVYDLNVEYEDIGSIRRFYLYLNNSLIKVVDDTDPLPIYNNMALFVRGSARCMFENISALSQNYSQNSSFTVVENINSVFGDKDIDATESFRKYSVSGVVKNTMLSGISSQQPPQYNMYFDEFGTIMRECSYFDIRYDQAYPALYAKLSPTINRLKGYTVSGFQADSYGAEFLIFNATDTLLNLDSTAGNYLRIQGITFTQSTTYDLTVDDYFNRYGDLSDPPLQGSTIIDSPFIQKQQYDLIKVSRMTYGKNAFSLNTPYIQTQGDADNLMKWIINKVMVPRKSIGVDVFAIPTLQLGDIVTIDYKNNQGINLVTNESSRFVIYNMEYSRDNSGPSMTLYLSEV